MILPNGKKGEHEPLRLLLVTNMYPLPKQPYYGIFVKEQVESLRQRGVHVEVLFINGSHNPLAYLWGAFRFICKTWFNSSHYDVIQAHHGYTAIITRLQWHLPLVATIHEAMATQKGMEPFMARHAVRLADLPIIVNKINYDACGDKRALIQSCGVDINLFQFMPRRQARHILGMDEQERIVLFAADPNRKHKRYDLALDAVKLLEKKGIIARLQALGRMEREDMPIYMCACNALIMPSDYESGPLVVKEALAVGLPIVAEAVGDVPQACRGHKNCFIVGNKPEDLAEGLYQAMLIPDEKRVRQYHSWFDHEYVMDQLLEVLKIVAGWKTGKRLVRGNLDYAVEANK